MKVFCKSIQPQINQEDRASGYIPDFYGKIICGDCGEAFRPAMRKVAKTGNRKPYWFCRHKYKGKGGKHGVKCQTPIVSDETIIALFEHILAEQGYEYPVYASERWHKLIHQIVFNHDGTATVILNSPNYNNCNANGDDDSDNKEKITIPLSTICKCKQAT